jgi:hypothetical protein
MTSAVQPPIRGQSVLRDRDGVQEMFVFTNDTVSKYSPTTNTWSGVVTSGTQPNIQGNLENVQAWYVQNDSNFFGGSDFTILINPDFPHYRLNHSTNEWIEINEGNKNATLARDLWQAPKRSVAVTTRGIYSFDRMGQYLDVDGQSLPFTYWNRGMSYPVNNQMPSGFNLPLPAIPNGATGAAFTGTEIIVYGPGSIPSGGYRFNPVYGNLTGLNVPDGFKSEPSRTLQWVEDRLFMVSNNPVSPLVFLRVFEPGKAYSLYVKP